MNLKLSIIIPAYNEERTLQEIVEKVQNINLPISKEIIIINDASTDSTGKIIENLKKNLTCLLKKMILNIFI